MYLLPVMPWAKNKKYFVVVRVLGLDCLVHGNIAVDIFLVPKTVDQHYRHLKRLSRENLIHGLVAPIRVIARMFEKLPPKTNLIETTTPSQLARRARFHKHVV